MAVNARTEEFQHIEVFDKPALFTNGRIARDTVPKGWYCYDIRGSDDDPGELCYMEENVVVNHAGSVLMPEKLAMPKSGRLDVRDELGFLDEGNMTLREFCEAHQLPYPAENMKFHIRPARPEEAGLFYTPHPEEDKRLGTVGHVRMDFGRSGNEFWHTWWPRGPEELNSPVFKAELQEVVDTLRESVLKNRFAMERFCYARGGKISGGWTQNYKDLTDPQLDTIEIMLSKLYARWGITEETELRQLASEDYPILSDLYDLMQEELAQYKPGALYTQELLQEVLLGLHSLCVGADAPFFNGHTNISGDRFLVFGVGGVLTAAKSLRNALLFNVLAYMSDRLLTGGNTVAVLDELYLWLSNPVAIEYIRNCLKRVRKRDSALVMASQNLEDFDQEGVREMTKPLFAIPPHQFLFNPGSIGKQFYMDMLQLGEAEFELIQRARRGECLYKCGMERYHLEVKAPTHKAVLFGSAGGR